ncbi:MAG: proton-conducting transporter membrane subunit [Candidatus Thermoplasmatota archaeon]
MMRPLLLAAATLAAASLTLPWLIKRHAATLGYGLAAIASLAIAALGAALVLTGDALTIPLPTSLPNVTLSLHADPLTGIFLIILGVGGCAVSLYATSYVQRAHADHMSLPAQTTFYTLFLAAILLVFLANDAVVFLIAWESMSILSYLLILTHEQDDDTRDAANMYLLMMHIGTAFLFVSFAALAAASGGTYSFDAMRAHARDAPEYLRSIAFVGALVGFGTKAGLVPLHGWLPRAHPAAPSHVSALMSGVMLKTAVYMMIRVGIDFLGRGPAWWGLTLLALGGITTFVGILYATAENDIKRLLAYSSVENLGVIFMGLGLALLFVSYDQPLLATLPLIAAVLHSLNHMTMKTLLFLGAGSVHHATGTRDINKLGGLIHQMPYTAGLVLLGSLAISALPPLNGFVSEWLLFQSLLAGVTIPGTPLILQIFLPVGAGLFALAGAISVVCFVKAFGVTFLATPRTSEAEHAHESPRTMLLGMGILATGIILIASMAGLVIRTLHQTLAPLLGADPNADLVTGGLVVQSLTTIKASMSPTLVFFIVLLFALLAWLGTRFLGSRERARKEETWLCGHRNVTPRMEYTSTSYAEATRMFFSGLYGPHKETTRDEKAPTIPSRITYATRTTYFLEEYAYAPITRLILLTSMRFRAVQAGSIHAYLSYIFATLLLVLLWATR